jgi:hypothetical protein
MIARLVVVSLLVAFSGKPVALVACEVLTCGGVAEANDPAAPEPAEGICHSTSSSENDLQVIASSGPCSHARTEDVVVLVQTKPADASLAIATDADPAGVVCDSTTSVAVYRSETELPSNVPQALALRR